MKPTVYFCESVEDYLSQADPIFSGREIEHSVMLGATTYLKQDINFYNVTPELMVVRAGEEPDAPLVFVAQMMYPWPLVISLPNPVLGAEDSVQLVEDSVSAFIAQAMPRFREKDVVPVKLVGPSNMITLVFDAMDDGDKKSLNRGKDIQFYQVTPATLTDPRLEMTKEMVVRRYDAEKDDAFVVEWLRQFQVDCFGACNESVLQKQMADYKALPHHLRGLFILFDDGQPVSLAGYGGPTTHTMRIANVFTPQQHRGKGYGQLVCWYVTKWLMTPPAEAPEQDNGLGCLSVAIAADLDNPTAVKIYTRIGFAPCVEFVEFEDAAGVAAAAVRRKGDALVSRKDTIYILTCLTSTLSWTVYQKAAPKSPKLCTLNPER